MLEMTARQLASILLAAHLRVTERHEESAIHAAADAHLTLMTAAVYAAFAYGRKAYKSGGMKAAVKAVRDKVRELLPSVLLKVVKAGGDVGFAQLSKQRSAIRVLKPGSAKTTLTVKFDVSNPAAVKWATEHVAELADGISATTEQRIKDAVASALEGDGIDAAYDLILDAVGNADRAEMIARTEVMDAANEGLAQSWDQAVESSLLTGDEQKVWIATEGACDECEAVDGEEVPLDEDFSVGDDPPAHPNCRCTMGLSMGAAQ